MRLKAAPDNHPVRLPSCTNSHIGPATGLTRGIQRFRSHPSQRRVSCELAENRLIYAN